MGSEVHARLRGEAWTVLGEARREGLVRRVGVSNFTVEHVRELRDGGGEGIRGMVVQMEIHPWWVLMSFSFFIISSLFNSLFNFPL